MHESGFRRWVVWGALVSASWLMPACGLLPQQPGNESYSPGFARNPAQAGYNGTIKDLGSSIDPRTPQTEGTPGRSLLMDAGERALFEQQQGRGGSGPASTSSPESGPLYPELGAEGGLGDPTRKRPAAQSIPGQTEPSGALPGERR